LHIKSRSLDDVLIVELDGNIDSKSTPETQSQVLRLIENYSKVILDMKKVDYLSSAGLRVLLLLYRQIKTLNRKIVLAGVAEEIKDVMQNTGFINFFYHRRKP